MFNNFKAYLSSMFRDENSKPSMSKTQLFINWIVVLGAYMYDVISYGASHSIELALGLLGIGAASRGVSQFNNFKYKSSQPSKSIFTGNNCNPSNGTNGG